MSDREIIAGENGVALARWLDGDREYLQAHGDGAYDVERDPEGTPKLVEFEVHRLVVLDEQGELIGSLSWHPVEYGPNRGSTAWNVGIGLLSAARGNGRGVAATRLLVKYLFTTTDVHRIEASTDVENVAAQRVLSRAGFGREGVLRGAQFRGGEHRDMVVYSVLRPAEPSTDALIQRDNVMLSELTAADRNTIAAGGDGLFDVDPDPRIPRYLGRGGALAVRAVDTGELLGDVSYAILTHGPTAASDTWNVGIELLPQARGRGVGTLAQRLLVEYLAATTDVDRFEASTDVDNIAEQRALEKAGFVREGIVRGAQVRGGVRRDVAQYSLLRTEV